MTTSQRSSIIGEMHVTSGLIIALCADGGWRWVGVALGLWGALVSLAAIKGMRDEKTERAA